MASRRPGETRSDARGRCYSQCGHNEGGLVLYHRNPDTVFVLGVACVGCTAAAFSACAASGIAVGSTCAASGIAVGCACVACVALDFICVACVASACAVLTSVSLRLHPFGLRLHCVQLRLRRQAQCLRR